MPKKDKGRKTGKGNASSSGPVSCPVKNEEEEYGRILSFPGGNHTQVDCSDGITRRCFIPGKMQRFKGGKTKLVKGDVVLISKRKEDDTIGDVLMKYPSDEARRMIRSGQIVFKKTQDEDDETGNNDDDIEFEDEDNNNKGKPTPKVNNDDFDFTQIW